MKKLCNTDPLDTEHPGRLLNVLCTMNLHPVSKREDDFDAMLIKKACTSSLARFSVFQFLIAMLFFEINTSVEILPELSKKFHTKRSYCMIAALWNCKHFQWICELKHLVNKEWLSGFAGIVEVGTGVPCFTKLSETPLKVLTVKNVKLNVQNTFGLRWINSFTVVFHGFWQ